MHPSQPRAPGPHPRRSEQSTEQNRAAFDEFVAAWNGRRLPARLYRGEVGAARTSHAWGIKGEPDLPCPPRSTPRPACLICLGRGFT